MASMSLYPPILDSSMPAFNSKKACKIEYSLSKFNSANEIKSIHISIVYQKSGINAVKKINDDEAQRYRSSGIIIINQPPVKEGTQDNLYSIIINPEDLSGENGWFAGEIYKVQIRFSSIEFPINEKESTESWLFKNANKFSEWSTVCSIKPIEDVSISIPTFNYNSSLKNEDVNSIKEIVLYSNILNFYGSYNCKTINEMLYSYEVYLYDENNELIESSGILYTNEYNNPNQFKYLFTTELINSERYFLKFVYKTEHDYTETLFFNFFVSVFLEKSPNFSIITVDNNINIEESNYLKKFIDENESTLETEEEEGRIGLKIYDIENQVFSGNICLKRTDSKSNFTKWEDIQIFVFKQELINKQEIYFDYTIESGIFYKYAIQIITVTPENEYIKSSITSMLKPIIRNFNYSYLLGENGIQLKLKYNNDMGSYKINVNEGKMDTIGGIYPFITRNGNPNYRTFPINGLISFNMDEMNTFSTKKEIYNDKTVDNKILDYYNQYNIQNNIVQYDYIYERFFREKVLKFLYDGKPKLFKSTTEGNIIVRIMDINTSPQQNLGRMVYSFSSTGHEVAEAKIENYLKYNFIQINEPEKNFSVNQTNIGQIIMDFKIGDNICQKIWEKYDSQKKNYAGYKHTLKSIRHLKIEINSEPFRIKNNSMNNEIISSEQDYVVGHKINYNGNIIVIYGNQSIYEFDSLITFTKDDVITFLGPDDPSLNDQIIINATVDFIYEINKDVYTEKQVLKYEYLSGIGQYYQNTPVNNSIYNFISYKYFIEGDKKFSRLNQLYNIEIEASPGAVFLIQDNNDLKEEYHEINYTGLLNLKNLTNIKELKFIGFRQSDGSILDKKYIKTIINENNIEEDIYEYFTTDILINYNYTLTKGVYA